jgi:arylformamidase
MGKIYDITVTITNDLPVWPGDPLVSLERITRIDEGEDANVSRLSMSAHSGTHMDAPYHFIDRGKTIEMLPLEALVGPVQVVQIPDTVEVITGKVVQNCGIQPDVERVLFKTRNSHFWPAREFHSDFTAVDGEGAQALVDMKLRLVGIDYLSIAPYHDTLPAHKILLGNEIAILEGCDLSQVQAGFYTLFALPAKLGGADGAPVRAILVED